jgi:Secretion system C-terminal sorting domain
MKLFRIFLFLLASYQPYTSEAQISGVVNSYFKVTNVIPSYNGIRVANISGLNVNDRVLIIQMKGAVINETDASTFGNITTINGAGLYEFATICGFLNDTVIFERELKHTYNYTNAVQLVRVPVYTNITVNGTLTAQEWNPVNETGGVVAISATGTVTLNANISADSAGYKGGARQIFTVCNFLAPSTAFYYSPPSVTSQPMNGAFKGEAINYTIISKEGGKGKQSNGGGGGNNHNTGGGGGSNYGIGGNGGRYTAGAFSCNGTNVGIGGLSLSSYGYSAANNRIFMGGGGGAGHDNNGFGTPGGKGGGIVFIEANELIGNGYAISANGSQGINTGNNFLNEAMGDGGGGGGGGGTVLMNVSTYTGNVTVQASGANGSRAGFQAQCPGPGGGGGGGVIWSNAVLPGNVTTSVIGGIAGIINDAIANPPCELTSQFATAGSNGALFSDFSISYEDVFNCLGVLPSAKIINWSGRKLSNSVSLKWELIDGEDVAEVLLEQKLNNGAYTVISTFSKPSNGSYNFTDNSVFNSAVYRLAIVSPNGSITYTRRLFFDRKQWNDLKIFPNPADKELQVQLPVNKGYAVIAVHDYTGRIVLSRNNINVSTQQVVVLPLLQLPAGVYFVSCHINGEIWKSKFIRQ